LVNAAQDRGGLVAAEIPAGALPQCGEDFARLLSPIASAASDTTTFGCVPIELRIA
jgi:hypothetical protein